MVRDQKAAGNKMTQATQAPATMPQGKAEDAQAPIKEIEDYVLNATNELLERVLSSAGDEILIEDRKQEGPRSGTLQDAEFGLMLLLALEQLGEADVLRGPIANPDKVDPLIVALVEKIVLRTTEQGKDDFQGGELEQGSPVFFPGEPYTSWTFQGQDYTSANLDAAMLIVGFLAAAQMRYQPRLTSRLWEKPDLAEFGIENFADAVLVVIHQGLLYAKKCRVFDHDGNFIGFSSDPYSAENPGDAEVSDEHRLFYTWTAAETLHELGGWADRIGSASFSKRLTKLLDDSLELLSELTASLKEAAAWCHRTFYFRFKSLDIPAVAEVVEQIEPLDDNPKLDSELKASLKRVDSYVKNVYHISQYAAIRSIAPGTVSVDEVQELSNIMQQIVKDRIIDSGLDAADHKLLFNTLTMYYSLGCIKRPEDGYKDDAYFPLIVRSLSGLLSRTIEHLDSASSLRSEVDGLVRLYRRNLLEHYQNMVIRRAEGDSDRMLWSYAKNKPFVLYATQRTVIALLEYRRFLKAMQQFEGPSGQELRSRLTELLSEQLARALLDPIVDDFLVAVADQATSARLPAANATVQGSGPAWLWEPLQFAVGRFCEEGTKRDIAGILEDYAKHVVDLQAGITAADDDNLAQRLDRTMKSICKDPVVGPRLDQLIKENNLRLPSVRQVLAVGLFYDFLTAEGSIEKLSSGNPAGVWKTIKTGREQLTGTTSKTSKNKA